MRAQQLRLRLPGAERGERKARHAQQGNDPRHPPPDVLRRRRAGGLRLPRPHARPEERQEDGPLRRRDPDLPPLLRQRRRATRARSSRRSPTARPGWMGKRGHQPAARRSSSSVPADSLGFWADRLGARAGSRPTEAELFGTQRLSSRTRAASRTRSSASTATTASPYEGARRRRPSTRSAARTARRRPCASPSRWTSSSRDGMGGAQARPPTARTTSTRSAPTDGHGRILELVEEPDLPQGTLAVRRGHDPPPRLRRGHRREPGRAQGLHRRPRLHRRLRRQGPRLLLLRLLPHARRRAVRVRLLDAAGLHDRRGGRRARHAHVHPAALGGPPREIAQLEPIEAVEKVVGVPGA